MVAKDIIVDVTITLATLSITFFFEYIDPTKYVSTALGIEDCISKTPAGNPDKSRNFISRNATRGPPITLTKPNVIALFQEVTFNLVKATPKDINTKNIVA